MIEKTTSKKSIATRVICWLVYSLTTLAFLLAYAHNEHLRKLNSDQFGPPDYYYDYHLNDSAWFIIAMLITLLMIKLTDWSIATARHQNLRNRWPLVITGILFYLAILILLLDVTIGGWGIPGRCGNGFSIGNCFLIDGLGEFVYLFCMPPLFICGTSLMIINRYTKYRENRKHYCESS